MSLIFGKQHKGVIQEFPNNGTHCVGGWQYVVANLPTGQTDSNGTAIYANYQISKNAGMYSTDNLGNVTEIALFPQNFTLTTSSATLNNVTVWSANSILTRDYADGRYAASGNYLTPANLTYANITGKPTLANVATSGNYTDLTGTPNLTVYLTTANATATYLPTANYNYANLTGPQDLLDTELIRAKLRDYSETISSPTISAGTLTLNLEISNIFTVSLNAAITTLTISNPPASGSGGSFTLILTADGTAWAVTWPASIKWAGGTAPTLTLTSGKIDTFAFFTSDAGTSWTGYVGGQNF